MKILFIGGLFPKNKEKYYFENSKQNFQAAANSWQWNVVEGIEKNLNKSIDIISGVFIAPFPKGYKKIIEHSYKWKHSNDSIDCSVGFINLLFLKNIIRSFTVGKAVRNWIKRNHEEESVIIVYSPHVPFLKTLKHAKKHNIKTCLVVPDLPDFTGISNMKNPVYRLAKKYDIMKFYKYQKYVDNYVFFTKHMASFFGAQDNYVVIEGIADSSLANREIENESVNTILYSGTLHSKYGIKEVVEAVKLIKDPNYRLIICGDGDSKSFILDASKKDSRISYLGTIPRNDVIKLQRKSTLLINPRPNNEIYTKYSFPSKTIEYLLSGKPVLCFKLDGIPDEYDNYLNYIDCLKPEHIASKIVEICEMDLQTRINRGIKARDFVLNNKNREEQTKKIINMMKIKND